jgi:hypothetical protein
MFTVVNAQHGYFSQLQAPNTSITQFLQQRVRDAEIQFTHDGGLSPPSYTLKAIDGSGLQSFEQAASINFKVVEKAASGIDYEKLYASVSSVGGVILSVAGYFWLRQRVASHRRGYDFANALRKAANLEYHDFMRFGGEVYRTKIDALVAQLKLPHRDFYDRLTIDERKSFAVCVAEILQERDLLSPSGCGDALYGCFFGFSVGWSQKLDIKAFEKQISEIARQAVAAWQAEENPLKRWPYHSPTPKDKANAWCCPRPSKAGLFMSQPAATPDSKREVELDEIKPFTPPSSPSIASTKEGEVAVTVKDPAPSSSRFFASSSSAAAVTEDRLQAFERQISENMKEMIAGSVKGLSDEIAQLKAETRPLLTGSISSSS